MHYTIILHALLCRPSDGYFFMKFKVYIMEARYTMYSHVLDYVLVSTIMLLALASIKIIIK